MTQYTITGFDASAHLSEETGSAAKAAAKGIWRSIFYSVIGGYILLLCVVFAIPNNAQGQPDNALAGGGVAPIFNAALGSNWAGTVLFVSAVGQFFCTVSCMTSASPHDLRVQPGRCHSRLEALVRAHREQGAGERRHAGRDLRAILTLPALIKVDVNGTPVPLAFYAVTSIAVIGLYLAFAIPIYLRWRYGDKFEVGSWNNGNKYKWMNPIAVAEIVIVSIYLMLPSTPAANPFRSEFEWKFVNYATDRDHRGVDPPHDLVAGLGQELVQGTEAHDRRGRGQGVRRLTGRE